MGASNADEEHTVDISNKSKKFDKPEDVEELIRLLKEKPNVKILKFFGNTLGIPAAERLGKELENYPNVSICKFSDFFTGRLKTEIAPALSHLSKGMMTANVKLVELDLSDNAFGPNGVVGVTELLSSPSCFTLLYLKMHNQGLGHQGCEYLAEALKKGRKASDKQGLKLKLFWGGRNRLENFGANLLSEVFCEMGTLEDIAIYQNGIGIHGVEGAISLANIMKSNPGLVSIDFSDNTINPEGAVHIANALKGLKKLKCLSLDDCLLKSEGAARICRVLENDESLPLLEKIRLNGNEMKSQSGERIVQALQNRRRLNHLALDANEFGPRSVSTIIKLLESMNLLGALHKPDDFTLEEAVEDDMEEIRQYAFGEDAGSDDEQEYEQEDEDEDEWEDENEDYYEEGEEEEEEEEEESHGPLDTSANTVVPTQAFSFRMAEQKVHQTSSSPAKPSLFSSVNSKQNEAVDLKGMFSSDKVGLFAKPLLAPSSVVEELADLLAKVSCEKGKTVDALRSRLIARKKPLSGAEVKSGLEKCQPEDLVHSALQLLEGEKLAPSDEDVLRQSCVTVLAQALGCEATTADNPVYTKASRASNALLVHLGVLKPEMGDREMKKLVKAAEPYHKRHLDVLSRVASCPEADSFSNAVRLSILTVLNQRKTKLIDLTQEVEHSVDSIVSLFRSKCAL